MSYRRVEYSLTDDGSSFNEAIHKLGEWGVRYSMGRAAGQGATAEGTGASE